MNRTDFENIIEQNGLRIAVAELSKECDEIVDEDTLKMYIVKQIEEDELVAADWVLHGLVENNSITDYYIYDWGLGTVEPINCVGDILQYIE